MLPWMSEGNAPDPDLQALQAAGNERDQRLGELFERHRQRLQRMVELRMDPALRQRVGASDVLQEAWLEISSRLGNYLDQPNMPFFLWIRFITAQRLLKLHRHHAGTKKRDVKRQVPVDRRGFPQATTAGMAHQLAASGISPSGVAVEAELRLQLEEALGSMREDDREVLVLRHFEELSNAETARELGIQPDAASKRYLRALERLRNVLARRPGAGNDTP